MTNWNIPGQFCLRPETCCKLEMDLRLRRYRFPSTGAVRSIQQVN